MKRILAFGNPVYDLISTPAYRNEERVLSGCSTNACLAVSKLGEKAIMVGTVGPDYAQQLQADLAHYGIEGRLHASAETGGFRLYYYDEHGNRNLSVLGMADPIPPQVEDYGAVDFILIGPILQEIPVALVEQLTARYQAPVMLDPQGLLRSVKHGEIEHALTDSFRAIARMSTIIKANEMETRIVTGIDPRQDARQAVKALYGFGGKIAITTLAEAGSIIYDGEKYYPIPAYATHAIDPTGAGDTYAAGFMVKYLETPDDLSAAGCFASAVASVMVENIGPEFPLTRPEADRRAAALMEQVSQQHG